MCFVLFSLAPCLVKEVWFSTANIDYSKPLNNSKTTSQANVCQHASQERRHISAAKKSNFLKRAGTVELSGKQYFASHSVKIEYGYSKSFSGNSPPRYILYKRLKIDVA